MFESAAKCCQQYIACGMMSTVFIGARSDVNLDLVSLIVLFHIGVYIRIPYFRYNAGPISVLTSVAMKTNGFHSTYENALNIWFLFRTFISLSHTIYRCNGQNTRKIHIVSQNLY